MDSKQLAKRLKHLGLRETERQEITTLYKTSGEAAALARINACTAARAKEFSRTQRDAEQALVDRLDV